jgi:hypothetical protein
MILVDLNESYQNILKSAHIARKKVPLLWGMGKKCHLYDLTRLSVRKKWGVKKLFFFGITGAICNGINKSWVYNDRGSQEQS